MVIKSRNSKNGYLFSPVLARYLDEKLKIEKLKEVSSEPGNKLSSIDQRRIKANDKNKVLILNNHIFRSLANLIYFFEYLSKHKELTGVFDNDVEELFGLSGPHLREAPSLDKYLVLVRFLNLILYYGITDTNSEKKEKRRKTLSKSDTDRNIGLQIARHSAKVIFRLIFKLCKDKDKSLSNIVTEDMKRLLVWIEYCTSGSEPSMRVPRRLINF